MVSSSKRTAGPVRTAAVGVVGGVGRPVVEIIRDLRGGTVSGRSLDGESRRACVAYLIAEGYGVAEIAALLGVSDRTVTRDRARVREDLAVERDPMLLPRTVGHLMAEAESTAMRLRRIARDKGAPAAARVEAERATWGITVDLVRLLQSLGYLPQAPRPLGGVGGMGARFRFGDEGDGDAPEVDELIAELTRIEAIAGGGDRGEGSGEADSDMRGADHELGTLRSDLGRLAVAARIAAIGRLVDGSVPRKDNADDEDEQEQGSRSSGDDGSRGGPGAPRRGRDGTQRPVGASARSPRHSSHPGTALSG